MSPRQAFISALHLFIVMAFFLAAFFFVALPFIPEIKSLVLEKSTYIGLALFLTSLLLFFSFYALERGKYLVIRMGVLADVNLIHRAVEECFARQLSKKIALFDVEIGRKSQLSFKVSLARLSQKGQQELLKETERHLQTLLRERFGYAKPFHLIVKS